MPTDSWGSSGNVGWGFYFFLISNVAVGWGYNLKVKRSWKLISVWSVSKQ